MNFELENDRCFVGDIKREGAAGNYSLKWTYNGLDLFIIICGHSSESVIVKDNNELQSIIRGAAESLPVNKIIKNDSVELRFYTREEYLREGYHLENKPGYYVVYGCTVDENNVLDTVYYSNNDKDRVKNVAVDIQIKQEDFYIAAGFFGKKSQYSGYKKVSITNGIKGIPRNTIMYGCSDNNYTFSVPATVLENGGYFFVLCNQNSSLRFTSSEPGIRVLQ